MNVVHTVRARDRWQERRACRNIAPRSPVESETIAPRAGEIIVSRIFLALSAAALLLTSACGSSKPVVADTSGANSHKHLHEFRCGGVEERPIRFPCYGTSQQCFPSSGGPHQQNASW